MSMMFARPIARYLAGPALAEALRESRQRSLALVSDLTDAQWLPPQQAGVNPIAWELAHLAWFAEFWILRGPHRVDGQGFIHAAQPARVAGPDAQFDSARLRHAQRWQTPLPARAQLLDRLDAQLQACLQALPDTESDEALYFHRLALFHEDMHAEAFCWMRAAQGYPAPALANLSLQPLAPNACLQIPAAQVQMGWPAGQRGFAFDNELPGHSLQLPAYEIDAAVVTAGQFLRFVEASGAAPPSRWRRTAVGDWQLHWFERWIPLAPDWPAIHVSAFEAEAYCAWAGRQLPSAAQWAHAAGSQRGFHWGRSVWEWTADAFVPYPGFVPGPYRDYSQPWFGSHRELRGGSFASHERLHDTRYRNFFTPGRSDIFAGFRTVSRA